MSLWKVELFENGEDAVPAKVGYLNADSEKSAVDVVVQTMGEANRADFKVVAKIASTLPPRQVLWVPDNA
ncbi:MAG: hypothetical protein WBO29_16140 [Albidovulum sp.]